MEIDSYQDMSWDKSVLWKSNCEKVLRVFRTHPEVRGAFKGAVGFSDDFQSCVHRVLLLAKSNLPVHLYGETGVGKEAFARALHELSGRAVRENAKGGKEKTPFECFNCALLGGDLQRDELFGHVPGSFTDGTKARVGVFEKADGGTLFLDEIGWLSPESQAMLNRVVEPDGDGFVSLRAIGSDADRKVKVRIVSAFREPLTLELYWDQQMKLSRHQLAIDTANEQIPSRYYKSKEVEEVSRSFLAIMKAQAMATSQQLVSVEAMEKDYEKQINRDRRLNEDLAYRLCGHAIYIAPLRFRPLDAIAITLYYAKTFDIDLHWKEVLRTATACGRGNARSIRSLLQEYDLKQKWGGGSMLFSSDTRLPNGRPSDKDTDFQLSMFSPHLKDCIEERIEMVSGYVDQLMELWDGKAAVGRPAKVLKEGEVLRALVKHKGNLTAAAPDLGVSLSTLKEKLKTLQFSGADLAKMLRSF